MTSELIGVHDFGFPVVNYIKACKVFINGAQRYQDCMPYWWKYSEIATMEFYRFYSKFIYKTRTVSPDSVYEEDPLKVLFDTISQLNEKTRAVANEFIIEKHEMFQPSVIPKNVDGFYVVVDYIEVREPILNFLQFKLKLDGTKTMESLRELFNSPANGLEYDEALDQKAKYLLGLELDATNYKVPRRKK